uniref:Uncharacterized protein n=1 Tax=Candidatus Kentrum sp. LPFa TaxID=2126335 RepID=A0A450VXP6_9GAMM|nr:MAG: hypothetical protein BECKLPF1236A_GA0070988_1002518 [Candidatus Kentron sp. LPFa]VFK25620.1 MAG: hypothetical protein BECKLPF1236C_GA0070990_1002319 [Candidatus Kentron sp. LPFa]
MKQQPGFVGRVTAAPRLTRPTNPGCCFIVNEEALASRDSAPKQERLCKYPRNTEKHVYSCRYDIFENFLQIFPEKINKMSDLYIK